MRILVQRVKSADVTVDGLRVAAAGKGMLLLVGIGLINDGPVTIMLDSKNPS